MWLHCPAAVRPCCRAPCLTRAYVKNVGRHLLRWSRPGPEGMEAECVCGGLAVPTVTSHTTELVLLSPFAAHCVLFTGRSVILWEATIEDLIRGEVQRLKLPKWEFREQSRCVSRKKNKTKKNTPSRNPICFYFRYLHVRRQYIKAVRLRPLSAAHEPTKRYSGIDFFPLCPRGSPAGLLPDAVWFCSQDFPKRSDVKDNRHG